MAEETPHRYELLIRDLETGHTIGAGATHVYDFIKPLRGKTREQYPAIKSQFHLMLHYFRKEVMSLEASAIGREEDEPIVKGTDVNLEEIEDADRKGQAEGPGRTDPSSDF